MLLLTFTDRVLHNKIALNDLRSQVLPKKKLTTSHTLHTQYTCMFYGSCTSSTLIIREITILKHHVNLKWNDLATTVSCVHDLQVCFRWTRLGVVNVPLKKWEVSANSTQVSESHTTYKLMGLGVSDFMSVGHIFAFLSSHHTFSSRAQILKCQSWCLGEYRIYHLPPLRLYILTVHFSFETSYPLIH